MTEFYCCLIDTDTGEVRDEFRTEYRNNGFEEMGGDSTTNEELGRVIRLIEDGTINEYNIGEYISVDDWCRWRYIIRYCLDRKNRRSEKYDKKH